MSGFILNPYSFGFAPTQIASLRIWLDAANRGSTSLQWDDRSGNGNHFTSSSSGEFPSFSGGIATFLTNDYLTGPNLSAFTEVEVFIRVKADNDPGVTNASGLWHFGTTTFGSHYPYTDGSIYEAFGSSNSRRVVNPTPSLSSWRVYNIWSKSNDWAMFLDGVSQVTSATNTVSLPTASTLCKAKDAGNYFNGQIKAMCIFNAKLSTADRALMEAYMQAL